MLISAMTLVFNVVQKGYAPYTTNMSFPSISEYQKVLERTDRSKIMKVDATFVNHKTFLFKDVAPLEYSKNRVERAAQIKEMEHLLRTHAIAEIPNHCPVFLDAWFAKKKDNTFRLLVNGKKAKMRGLIDPNTTKNSFGVEHLHAGRAVIQLASAPGSYFFQIDLKAGY